jgi:OmpA-OmpF porin, OOP family
MTKKIAVAFLLSAVFAAPALAAEPRTFYGAIELGTWTQKDSGFANPGVVVVTGGYRLTSQVAFELGLYLPGYTTIDYGAGNTVTAKQSAFKAAVVGTLPVSEKFDLFGKVGFSSVYGQQDGTGIYSTTYSTTTSNVMYGLGGQFNINKSFGLRLQYESLGQRKLAPTATAVDISVTSLGLVYNF